MLGNIGIAMGWIDTFGMFINYNILSLSTALFALIAVSEWNDALAEWLDTNVFDPIAFEAVSVWNRIKEN